MLTRDCGVVGHAKDFEQVLLRYGTILLKADGIHIGSSFVPREKYDKGRDGLIG